MVFSRSLSPASQPKGKQAKRFFAQGDMATGAGTPPPPMTTTSLPYIAAPRLSLRSIAVVAAAHVALLGILATLNVVPVPAAISTLMVDIVHAQPPAPADPTPPKPVPAVQKPAPQRTTKPLPQPILAAPSESAASSIEIPVAKEQTPAAPPAPAVLSQPRFDADYLSNPAPAYPPLSRRLGEEGKVVLRVHVEPNGRPSQIELKSSSGSLRLDQAAQDAVWRWKFVPAKRGDEAIAAWVLVPIVFNLKN
jgi:periplasmic protein TonB